jgi:hypothetical protein
VRAVLQRRTQREPGDAMLREANHSSDCLHARRKTYFLTTARPGHLLNLRAPPRPGRKLVPQIVSPHLAGFLIAACCSVSVGDVRARAAVLGPEQVEASVQRCLSSFLRRNPRIAIAESRVVEVRLLRRGESGPGTALKMANAYRYALPSEIADLSAVNIDMIWKPRRTHALHRSTKFGCLMSEGGRVISTYSLAAPR